MIEYIPGLEHVPAAESAISFIDGEKGILRYRGILIEDLAAHSTFEEVAYLLMTGRLPNEQELSELSQHLGEARKLSPELRAVIKSLPKNAPPMAVLQTCVAAVGAVQAPSSVYDETSRHRSAIEFIGKFPAIVAAFQRHRTGKDFIEANPSASHAGDFLHMLTGEKPDPLKVKAMDTCLILHADHTMNASTFCTRVTGSTECQASAAFSAAVGSLSGPLHGGANEAVLRQLESIGSKDRTAAWFEEKLAKKEKIMGMGHRVYKTKDPRSYILQGLARELFEKFGSFPLYDVATELERCAIDKLGPRGIYPNVDFYAGIVYARLGIPSDMGTPIFAVSRIAGWASHWMEQMRHNRIFRPTQVYQGEASAPYIPMSERKAPVRA
ncbi:MAG TPA: citrate/2-methylcitrate synthase [Candidatus Krumholzibacteria bacterium]|nr:citrate/2-methylcitrate synthase [Candidatus Krumholzibacteria bacterium]